MPKSLIILSGPSCVGKGPLKIALDQFRSIKYGTIPVIKSKESRKGKPRPDEQDKWNDPDFFRTAAQIEALNDNLRFIVGDCRGHPQAIDLKKVRSSSDDLVFIEVYHTIGSQLKGSTYLAQTRIVTVFLSPISKLEILDLRASYTDVECYIKNLMLHKLAVRARFQAEDLTAEIIADNRDRSSDAPRELRSAHHYTHVLVNHDGEGNFNWHMHPDGTFDQEPEGDAKRSLEAFAQILTTGNSSAAEQWNKDVI